MTVASIEEVNQMKQAMSALENPEQVAPSSGKDDTMKAILESYYNAGGDKVIDYNPELAPQYNREPVHEPSSYTVEQIICEGENTSRKKYTVFDEHRNEVISNLTLRETANAAMKYLERGTPLNSKAMMELVELEESYNRYQQEASANRKHYERCLELGETEAADVFNRRQVIAKAERVAVKEAIIAVLNSIR